MRYLIIVAHPDDEVLGVGGFIYDRTEAGDSICVVIANETDIPSRPDLISGMAESHGILGIGRHHGLGLQNLRISEYSSADVVPKLEEIIESFQPDYIFTHSPADINPDHRAVSEFAQQAARYAQRKPNRHRISGLMYMEVPSSTDWGSGDFHPDTFLEISGKALDRKIQALACYQNVLRQDTHPRSYRAIRALATFRGCTVGVPYAEAIQTCWRIGGAI